MGREGRKSRLAKAAGGTKHICKSKSKGTEGYRPLLEAPMSKNGTPLWREAYLQVKMYKNTCVSQLVSSSLRQLISQLASLSVSQLVRYS